MPTLEQAAKAWTDLGRVLYPSLAEVEAALNGRAHSVIDKVGVHPMTAQQLHESEED